MAEQATSGIPKLRAIHERMQRPGPDSVFSPPSARATMLLYAAFFLLVGGVLRAVDTTAQAIKLAALNNIQTAMQETNATSVLGFSKGGTQAGDELATVDTSAAEDTSKPVPGRTDGPSDESVMGTQQLAGQQEEALQQTNTTLPSPVDRAATVSCNSIEGPPDEFRGISAMRAENITEGPVADFKQILENATASQIEDLNNKTETITIGGDDSLRQPIVRAKLVQDKKRMPSVEAEIRAADQKQVNNDTKSPPTSANKSNKTSGVKTQSIHNFSEPAQCALQAVDSGEQLEEDVSRAGVGAVSFSQAHSLESSSDSEKFADQQA